MCASYANIYARGGHKVQNFFCSPHFGKGVSITPWRDIAELQCINFFLKKSQIPQDFGGLLGGD